MKTLTTMRPAIGNFYPDNVYGSDRCVGSALEDSPRELVTTESGPRGFAPLVIESSSQPCWPQISEVRSEPYPFVIMLDNIVCRRDTTPSSGETLLGRTIWDLSIQGATAGDGPARLPARQGSGLDRVGAYKLSADVLRGVYATMRSQFRRLATPQAGASQVPNVASPVSPAVAAHLAYLDRMADRGVVSRPLADSAKAVWYAVETATRSSLTVPAASAVEGGPIRYTWRHAGQWLTVAISEGGLCEWTYLHSDNDELWGEDSTAGAAPSTELETYMSRLLG